MNKHLLVFVLLSFLCLPALAQSPGYMGKKLIVHYENSFMQTYRHPNSKGRAVSAYGAENVFFSFNSTHSFAAEYVTGRRRTWGLSLKYLRTGVFTSNNYYSLSPPRYPLGIIRAYGIGIKTKGFNSKYIAPWGFYREWEFFVLMHRMENFYPSKYYPVKPATVVYPMFKNAGASFAFGKQRVIADKITLNYGAKLGILFIRDYYSTYDHPQFTEEELRVKTNSTHRLFRHQLFSITTGIGFLAR
jgi:hypothetical protein